MQRNSPIQSNLPPNIRKDAYTHWLHERGLTFLAPKPQEVWFKLTGQPDAKLGIMTTCLDLNEPFLPAERELLIKIIQALKLSGRDIIFIAIKQPIPTEHRSIDELRRAINERLGIHLS